MPWARKVIFLLVATTTLSLGPEVVKAATSSIDIAAKPDGTSLVDRGRHAFKEGLLGSSSAVKQAVQDFSRALAAEPHNEVIRALLGTATVLKARDAPLSQKIGLARKGFALLDAAKKAAPENRQVRLIRAINSYLLGYLGGRHSIAKADFAWIQRDLARHASSYPPDLRRFALFHLGAFLLQEGQPECLNYLQRALATTGSDPSDTAISTMLSIARRQFSNSNSHDQSQR